MDMPSLLERRSTDTELIGLVVRLAETVRRLEEKVDMLIIQRADEFPDTSPGCWLDEDLSKVQNYGGAAKNSATG